MNRIRMASALALGMIAACGDSAFRSAEILDGARDKSVLAADGAKFLDSFKIE